MYERNIMVAFFLLRHALELGIKALITDCDEYSTDNKLYGHNLKKLWKKVDDPSLEPNFEKDVLKGFETLKKYKLEEDAQFIRYHIDIKGNKIEELDSIEHADFEELERIVTNVWRAVLEKLDDRSIHLLQTKQSQQLLQPINK